jgi:hypothetical protein
MLDTLTTGAFRQERESLGYGAGVCASHVTSIRGDHARTAPGRAPAPPPHERRDYVDMPSTSRRVCSGPQDASRVAR